MLILNIACLHVSLPSPPTAQAMRENSVIVIYHFRSKIPPFVKARTVLEGLEPKHEETIDVKQDPYTEVMIKVLVMNQSCIKLQ